MLSERPWVFDGCTLLLKQVTRFEKYSKVQFDMAGFWVNVYDVLGIKQTKAFGVCLANKVGKFCDADSDNLT